MMTQLKLAPPPEPVTANDVISRLRAPGYVTPEKIDMVADAIARRIAGDEWASRMAEKLVRGAA